MKLTVQKAEQKICPFMSSFMFDNSYEPPQSVFQKCFCKADSCLAWVQIEDVFFDKKTIKKENITVGDDGYPINETITINDYEYYLDEDRPVDCHEKPSEFYFCAKIPLAREKCIGYCKLIIREGVNEKSH